MKYQAVSVESYNDSNKKNRFFYAFWTFFLLCLAYFLHTLERTISFEQSGCQYLLEQCFLNIGLWTPRRSWAGFQRGHEPSAVSEQNLVSGVLQASNWYKYRTCTKKHLKRNSLWCNTYFERGKNPHFFALFTLVEITERFHGAKLASPNNLSYLGKKKV